MVDYPEYGGENHWDVIRKGLITCPAIITTEQIKTKSTYVCSLVMAIVFIVSSAEIILSWGYSWSTSTRQMYCASNCCFPSHRLGWAIFLGGFAFDGLHKESALLIFNEKKITMTRYLRVPSNAKVCNWCKSLSLKIYACTEMKALTQIPEVSRCTDITLKVQQLRVVSNLSASWCKN